MKKRSTFPSSPLVARLLWLIWPLLLAVQVVQAQTAGLVVRAAVGGRAVLDPNGDGYVSRFATGFVANDVAESEVPYRPMAQVQPEPISDVRTGPSGGFTDFVDLGTAASSLTYLSPAGNLMFRFRLGSIANNSKGYSILIDTDNKFGNTGANADPTFTATNPGFEVEILLATNFGVRLYNVDAGVTQLVELNDRDYSQKAIAYTVGSTNLDYFYDFYMPFSVITSFIPSFTANTSIRMVANTVISPRSVLSGGPSDISGLNDAAYPSYTSAWSAIVAGTVPRPSDSLTTGPLPAIRTAAPTVYNNLAAGATSIGGSSVEANGTVITVYVNGVLVGTTTVSGNTWTLAGVTALTAGQTVTATAQATGKSLSNLSNTATVTASPPVCTAAPVITGRDNGNRGYAGTALPGAVVRLYVDASNTPQNGFNSANAAVTSVIADASGNWFFYWCTNGNNCIPCGSITARAQLGAQCESGSSSAECVNSNQACGNGTTIIQTATPVITNNPLLPSTTITGTAAAGSVVTLRINGYVRTTQTLGAGVTAYSFAGQTFKVGDVISITAKQGANCTSIQALITANDPSAAPVVNSPIYAGATSVSGTSTEAPGTAITVFRNGVSIGTATVSATGTWSLTGLAAGTFVAGNTVTATAAPTGKSVSPVSATVTVLALPATTAAPVITASPGYSEGDTSITGTAPANSSVSVFIDGALLGTVTASATGTWTLSGLSRAKVDLYAGGTLNATATSPGLLVSPLSAGVVVKCLSLVNKSLSTLTPQICVNQAASVSVLSSASGIIYTLRNFTNTAFAGTSALGTGADLPLDSYKQSASGTVNFKVLAQFAESPSCPSLAMSGTASVVVNNYPTVTMTTSSLGQVCTGGSAPITVASSQSGFTYQLFNGASAAGSVVTGTGGTITLNTPTLSTATTFSIKAIDIIRPSLCAASLTQTQFIAINCPSIYTISAGANQDSYVLNQTVGTVTDPEGTVNLASVAAGSLPPGVTLNTSTGAFSISNAGLVAPGSYTLSVSTRDAGGFTTTQPVTIVILADLEASAIIQPARTTIEYYADDELARATDANGVIVSASLASGSLPPGTALGPNGRVTVTNIALLLPGTYSFQVSTVDATGGRTTQTMSITMNSAPILPVKLLSFTAARRGSGVLVSWSFSPGQIAGETVLERLTEKGELTPLLRQEAEANKSFRYVDQAPPMGTSIYRLRYTETDGTYSYGPMREVSWTLTGKGSGFSIHPNPAWSGASIVVSGETSIISPRRLQVVSLDGKRVLARTLTADGKLSLDGVAPGYYMVLLEGYRPERLVIVR